MKKLNKSTFILIVAFLSIVLLFVYLYQKTIPPVENVAEHLENTSSLADWSISSSKLNNMKLDEDKDIYEQDNNIYDVYLTVYPTKDETGTVLDFSAFDLHTARDHTYNPTLDCNILILNEGEYFDPSMIGTQGNATIRVRGNSARGEDYKSYKIKLDDEAETFKGQTSLNINKHAEDNYKIVTKLLMDMLVDVDDMVSYRTNFMRVWICDSSLPKEEQSYQYYGLFTNTEQPNNTYLETRSLPTGHMYKARNFSFQLNDALVDTDDPSYNKDAFEEILSVREGDGTHTKLLEMLAAVNDPTVSSEEIFSTYFDEDNYLTWLAFNILVGGQDILNHNYIIYSPYNSQKWYLFPWDLDANLQNRDFENTLESFDPTSSTRPAPSLVAGQKLIMSSLHKRYLQMDGNLEKIQAKMEYLLEEVFTEEAIQEKIDGYLPVLEKTIVLEPDIGLLGSNTPTEILNDLLTFRENFLHNYEAFLYAFEFSTPMFVSMPEVEQGTVSLSWSPSYSYQGRTITYSVSLATDCYMVNTFYNEKNIVSNNIKIDVDLDPGTYYLLVTATDSAGNEQYSLEHYEFAGNTFIYANGVLEFVVE